MKIDKRIKVIFIINKFCNKFDKYTFRNCANSITRRIFKLMKKFERDRVKYYCFNIVFCHTLKCFRIRT